MTTELFEVVTPATALQRLLEHLTGPLGEERVPIAEALGRVLVSDVFAPESSPTFRRSVMDGYAVRAADTFGATEGQPAYLGVAGEVPMGEFAGESLDVGAGMRIHTGGMLPPLADAVVMVEHTQPVDSRTIEVVRAVAPGENVVQPGEDLEKGDHVLGAGHRIRPQDIGALAALGITTLGAARLPLVGILSSGDEVVQSDETPGPGQVRDLNSESLAAATRWAGAAVRQYGIAPDDAVVLHAMASRAHRECDLVVVSAGSSVSTRDLTAQAIRVLGAPGVLVHGVSVKPGKPTILAVAAGKPVFGLPGNPVSALVIFNLLVAPVIGCLLGAAGDSPVPTVRARLTRNIPSQAGRVDFVQARLVDRNGECWAEPLFGKSNLIFTMVRAAGTIRVPLDLAGLSEGTWIDVQLY